MGYPRLHRDDVASRETVTIQHTTQQAAIGVDPQLLANCPAVRAKVAMAF